MALKYQRRTPSPMEVQREGALSPVERAVTPDQINQNKSPRKPSPKALLEFDPISAKDFPRPSAQPSNSRVRSKSVVPRASLSPERFSSLRRSASEENSGRMLDLLSLQESCNENKYSLDMITTDNGPGSWTTPRLGNNNTDGIQGPIQGSGGCIDDSEIVAEPLLMNNMNKGQSRESLRSRPIGPNIMSIEQSNIFSNTITMPGSRECLQSRPVPTVALRLAKDSNSKEDIAQTDFHQSHFKRLSAQTQQTVV